MTEPISEICTKNRPIIVQFQSGEIEEGQDDKLFHSVYKNENNEKIAVVATKEILYKGKVNNEEELYNNFLLVRNRKTGKVRLIQVDSALLLPQLKQKRLMDTPAETLSSSVRELHKQFGSKRIKRATEQRERLQMDISNVKEHLEQTVAGIELDESDVLTTKIDENDNLYRPPIDREAETKEQVYNLESIIPPHILNELEEEAQAVLNSDLDDYELCSYIKTQMGRLQEAVDSNQEEKAMILLYVNYLIKYMLTPAKNVNSRLVICKSSKEVNNFIIENFSLASNNGRTRPLSMKDKIICQVLVLCMIALDYQLDISDLSKEMKVGTKKLQDIGRVLAFSPQGKDKNVLILKLPLPAPISISPKKRKR